MAWLVVLLAAWSVLDDDLPVLPVLIFAASFCMQTHLPYLGLAGGLVAVVVVIAAVATVLRRDDATRRRDLLRWGLVAVGVGVLVWIPPVLDELTNSPGNLTLIWRDLTNPPVASTRECACCSSTSTPGPSWGPGRCTARRTPRSSPERCSPSSGSRRWWPPGASGCAPW
jgi:hypothetical protein